VTVDIGAALELLQRTIGLSSTQVLRMVAAGMIGAKTTTGVAQLACLAHRQSIRLRQLH
jgi:hypothetical protein